MTSTDPSATSTVEIAGRPAAVYAIITDLAAMAELAEETTAMRWAKGDSARPGAVFKGRNRNGWRRWTTTCTVTDADEGRCFAFEVRHTIFPVSRWQYDIVGTASGCTVTESTWDRRPAWFKGVGGLATGTPDRQGANAAHIATTLDRLKARVESAVVPNQP